MAEAHKKTPTERGWGFEYWWSRRESNPRPQALYNQFYILSPVFCFNRTDADEHASLRRVTEFLAPAP